MREAIANALDNQVCQTQAERVYELMARWVHDLDANVRIIAQKVQAKQAKRGIT